MKASPCLALALLLLVGCPPGEEEERRAATLAFLRAEPTPSSIAVLQPGVAAKLAEVEPSVTDPVQRDRIVVALVLDDTDDSHQLLLELLERDPELTSTAFDTARRYDRLTGYLALLHEHLDGPVREDVFVDVCWPVLAAAAPGGDPGAATACLDLWGAETAAQQVRWMRLASQRGPHDDPTPYRALETGLAADAAADWELLVSRIAGGDVVPADAGSRDALRLTALIDERASRRSGTARRARSVPFEGGYVELVPPAADSDLGRLGGALLDDVPASCVEAWGSEARREGLLLEIRTQGSKGPPTVAAVDTDEAAVHGEDDDASPAAAREETLRACVEAALAPIHEAGDVAWAPRTGATRISIRAHTGRDPRAAALLGDNDLTAAELRELGDALRESGSDEWRARLADRDPPLLRDLGAADLGFCAAYVAAGWDDCAQWLGALAADDDDLAAVLLRGLGDADGAIRGLCRAALSTTMDAESLASAAAAAEATGGEDQPSGDSEDEPTTAEAGGDAATPVDEAGAGGEGAGG